MGPHFVAVITGKPAQFAVHGAHRDDLHADRGSGEHLAVDMNAPAHAAIFFRQRNDFALTRPDNDEPAAYTRAARQTGLHVSSPDLAPGGKIERRDLAFAP